MVEQKPYNDSLSAWDEYLLANYYMYNESTKMQNDLRFVYTAVCNVLATLANWIWIRVQSTNTRKAR